MTEEHEINTKGLDEKFCSECGKKIKAKAEICPHCGVRQSAPPSPFTSTTPNGKNKYIAALVAFFLGGFGAHKFYLGQIGLGIVYLLFCWTVIPAIIALVECIILVSMDDETFKQKYGMIDN
ncbi:MAG: zinc-ribbon domain and TM2 domain-containing protein [Desulfotalea sp.]